MDADLNPTRARSVRAAPPGGGRWRRTIDLTTPTPTTRLRYVPARFDHAEARPHLGVDRRRTVTATPAPDVATAAGAGTARRWSPRPVPTALVALDVSAWALATLVARPSATILGLLPAIIGLYALAGLYRSRLTLSVLADASQLLTRPVAAAGALAGIGEIATGRAHVALLAAGALTGALSFTFRAIGYAVVRRARSRGAVGHTTLILGAGRVGAQVVDLLREHPEYGLRPVGFLDSDPLLSARERPVPLLGGDDDLARTIVDRQVGVVVVAFGSLPESMLVEVIRTCDKLDVEIFFIPRLFELYFTGRDADHVWGLPLVRLRAPAFRSPAWRVKRAFDVVVSGVALTLLAPVMAAVAIAVRLEGGPGVIFRQTRVGLDGRPFSVMKFRSLKPADETESQTNWNITNDARLGRVGRILRRTSLDELPQLINILRGDMSIVGPRPERPHFVDQFASLYPRYTARHRVPAGLTGWSQVHGLRGDTSIEERARFDNYYIENWTL
ncbi:MAG TPA: sugar transferase, partial [Mycobacteriales bacterium]|nr:sugar transferase [Mycobacteriales bacterium]